MQPRRPLGYAICLGLILCIQTGPAVADEFPPTYISTDKIAQVAHTDISPKIDGRLDDAVWLTAPALTDFHQVEPVEFAEPTKKTEIYLLYDEDALYIGARMFDDQPEKILANQLIQGASLRGDDTLTIVLDPFANRRSGYAFFINGNGIRREAIFEDVDELNLDWRGIWRVESKIDKEGWTAEIEIPFKTLNFDPKKDTWGFSAFRRIARSGERTAWTSQDRKVNPSTAGRLSGLTGIRQGLGLDIIPSIAFRESRDFVTGMSDFNTVPAITAIYKITPSMTGLAMSNIDFSDAAVDDRIVNLSRFSIFQPEQRDFFLQDADIFTFGGLSGNAAPFFSRRVGLNEDGEPVQLKFGAKLTGRLGPVNLGVMDVVQSEHALADQTNLIVGRATMNVLEESSLGAVFTSGDPNSDRENWLGGADFLYRSSTLFPGRTATANFWYQQTVTDDLEDDSQAYGFNAELNSSVGYWGELWWETIEENYFPALGFANRTGIHKYGSVGGHSFRLEDSWIRSITPGYFVEEVQSSDFDFESGIYSFQPFWLRSHKGYELRLRVMQWREVLDEGFEIIEGLDIDPDDYKGYRTTLFYKTPNTKPWSVEGEIRIGEFFGGHRHTVRTGVDWRPNKHFHFGADYTHNDVDLRNGDFVARLASVRANVAFNSKWSWLNVVQYDNISDVASLNSRLRWTPVAGQDFVFVFNNTSDVLKDWHIRTTESEGIFKITYTKRY